MPGCSDVGSRCVKSEKSAGLGRSAKHHAHENSNDTHWRWMHNSAGAALRKHGARGKLNQV